MENDLELLTLLEKSFESVKPNRFILGLTGAPAAGKSTLAENLCTRWNDKHQNTAIIVPMDGYHLSNEQLKEAGTLHLKGVPKTFDAVGFVNKIRKIKNEPNKIHYCPLFDRSIEASIQDEIRVLPTHTMIIVEGNYLLLESEPWASLREHFDEVWFIEADAEALAQRLLERHQSAGKNTQEAQEKMNSTDLPNAELIGNTRSRATRIVR